MNFPFAKEAISKLFSKPSCAMYPVVPSEAAENYRGRIAYHPDKCIGCGMCERVCSGGAITRVIEPLEGGDSKVTLTFNLGSCTFCATCADFCNNHAIEFTKDYHMVATKEEDLLVTGSFIKKAPVKKTVPPKPATTAGEAQADTTSAQEVKPRDDGKPVNDPSKCVFCTLCAKKCPAGAIEVNRAEKTWTLDEEKCIGCGTCADTCPKNCILL